MTDQQQTEKPSALSRAYAECDRLTDELREYSIRLNGLVAALRAISDHWTPVHDAKIAEWHGAGTEAYDDLDLVRAEAIKPLCGIARTAVKSVEEAEAAALAKHKAEASHV